jgi:hypothetical protein
MIQNVFNLNDLMMYQKLDFLVFDKELEYPSQSPQKCVRADKLGYESQMSAF